MTRAADSIGQQGGAAIASRLPAPAAPLDTPSEKQPAQ